MGKQTVPVSKRALLQRINRVLAKNDEMVKTLRGDRWEGEMGRHYRIDTHRNYVIEKHVDLEATAKALGVLAPWERLVEA